MAIGLAVIMGGIGAIIAMMIGILIFGEVEQAIDCNAVLSDSAKQACESAKGTAWIVIGILPIALFFALFSIFGGIGGGLEDDRPIQNRARPTETKKQRQKRKQAKVDLELAQYDDKVVHSFLTNWFRRSKN